MNPQGATRQTRSSRTTAQKNTLLYARPGIIVTVDRFTVGRNSWQVTELTHLQTGRARTTASRYGPSWSPAP